jgi:hypothetical protein
MMPRVLVTTDDSSRQVLSDEEVNAEHRDTDHSAGQLIERLRWGIQDAVTAERAFKDALPPRSYGGVAG